MTLKSVAHYLTNSPDQDLSAHFTTFPPHYVEPKIELSCFCYSSWKRFHYFPRSNVTFRNTCILHMCFTPVFYTCLLHVCFTRVFCTCVLHLYFTRVFYTCILHVCFTRRDPVISPLTPKREDQLSSTLQYFRCSSFVSWGHWLSPWPQKAPCRCDSWPT
jgi:hypothetical protein